MEVCKEELCESNEIHEDLLKIVDETLPEETELYDLAELFKVSYRQRIPTSGKSL